MNLCDIGDIRALLGRHGFHFSKGLGQNFLCDESVPQAIAERAGIDGDTCVLEVGPGIGCLTQQLCARACRVAAVELDGRLAPILAETMEGRDNFALVQGDILKINIPALCAQEFGEKRAVACANLPYYITSPAVAALLESRCFSDVTVMVQREVALRMGAAAGTKDYGAFSVFVQWYAEPQIVLEVGRECFVPQPKVDSAVVRLHVRREPPALVASEEMFFRVVKAAFSQRRKTLLNCLTPAFPAVGDKGEMEKRLQDCGVDPGVRGETLDISAFANIANHLG